MNLFQPSDATVSPDGLAHTRGSGERWYELPSEPGRRFPSITTIISAGNPGKFASVDRREVALAALAIIETQDAEIKRLVDAARAIESPDDFERVADLYLRKDEDQ